MSNIPFTIDTVAPGTLRTDGLAPLGYSDLMAHVSTPDLTEALGQMLRDLGARQIHDGAAIQPDDTLSFGYWPVRATSHAKGILNLREPSREGDGLLTGVDYTLRIWVDQQETCRRASAPFAPPLPSQMVAVSEGVVEGDRPLAGVRYVAPGHMSGWYLSTDRYNGDIDTMRVEHLYHITAVRPEIARYIALPPGYRFILWPDAPDADDIWFDEHVSAQS